jgi:hypothetical protein
LAFYLHPVRFKLEERLGHEIVDYIFNRVKPWNKGEINALQRAADAGEGLKHNRPPPGRELPPIHRTQSTASVISVKGSGELLGKPDAKFTMVPIRDAAEMKRRASANRTFIRVIFGSTSIVLSYKV